MYDDDEFLALSGIQHFAFCPRQWGLIHIERAWADNVLTVQGTMMHARAHDTTIRERRGGTLTVRNLYIRSPRLGISGMCDVVEFHEAKDGHPIAGEQGLWRASPIEYKRGSSKSSDADRLQLCAQAMCLEETFASDIACGYLFYGQTKSREQVTFTDALRCEVVRCTSEMHRLYERRHVPKARHRASCRSCSLNDLCLPKTSSHSVSGYIDAALEHP